ncbi:MAG: ATP citrate lyase [Nitrospirae bacterium RIFCSPLOWO2_01_FULL_62_17]|nr:MAG: ATP citrate lyase [Nitrospirae bacterium RIFCSPLOWO2_01_FULL_62_17]OGX13940.1 MAG: ATP citrate lyase [Nitrospirae bacterium RIFCSPLOWO2_12_FULL_63_8]
MAKVLEGPGMGLMKKWGIAVPNYVVVTSVDELAKLGEANEWMKKSKLVAKAHEALGSRFKLGLVKVGLDLKGAVAAAKEMLGRQVGSITVTQVIVSEMVPHKDEYYVAVKSTREGSEVLVANCGGIEVESNWDRVKKLQIDVGGKPSEAALEKLAKDAGFSGGLVKKVAEFAGKMFTCFDSEDAQYLEVNPVVVREGDGELIALDAVTLLDGDAKFRHPDWNFAFAAEFGRAYSKDELDVMAVDSKIKGSVKFIQIPGGNIAMLPAGGGASVYYSDAVVARGGKLANYAEYSGDPPDWAVEVLTEKVASLPDIKHIIVGGAIANFTDVKKTFGGIIAGFRKAKADGKLKGVKIWVRRGGPNEKEGLELMRKLKDEGFDIHVYDRKTPLTDIVDMALQKKS